MTKVCARCGGTGHSPRYCPWLKKHRVDVVAFDVLSLKDVRVETKSFRWEWMAKLLTLFINLSPCFGSTKFMAERR